MNNTDMLQHLFDEHMEKAQHQLDTMSLYDEASDFAESIANMNQFLNGMNELINMRQRLGLEGSMYLPPKKEAPRLEKTYVFERKLRGGIIRVNNSDYYIPEQMVLDMNIDHGDELRITDTIPLSEGRVRYMLDVVERFGGKHPSRKTLSGTVIRDVDEDCLRVQDPDTGLFVRITSKDQVRFQLHGGEAVTLAYYDNNPEISAVFSKDSGGELFRMLYVMPENTHYLQRYEDIPVYFEKATRYHGTENTMTTNSMERQHNILVIFDEGKRLVLPGPISELSERFSENGKPVFICNPGEYPEPSVILSHLQAMR